MFDRVISVEAWRLPCTSEEAGSVHVDVTFLEARLGEESDSKVRFKMALDRVVVRVTASSVDPVRIIPSTVDRGEKHTIQVKKVKSTKSSAGASANAELSAGSMPLKPRLSGSASAAVENQTTITSDIKTTEFVVSQYKIGDSYCWSISGISGKSLLGKVWNPETEPRCSIKLSATKTSSSDCEVRLDVDCKREDIKITSIESKERDRLSLYSSKNRMAAAEAVLKKLLVQKGFAVDNMQEKYGDIPLASISIPEC